MTKYFRQKFLTDENGAVTVDWVVLTAAIVTLSIAVLFIISPALLSTATDISETVEAVIN